MDRRVRRAEQVETPVRKAGFMPIFVNFQAFILNAKRFQRRPRNLKRCDFEPLLSDDGCSKVRDQGKRDVWKNLLGDVACVPRTLR
jgi:hypothetical protein